jgi:thiosulfate dehydrogenase (quinone) large subunit
LVAAAPVLLVMKREYPMSLPGQVLQGILARGALVLLRVYLGTIFLVAALPKLRQDFTPSLMDFVQQVGLNRSPPFYQRFLEHVVLPNATVFAALVTGAELLVGVTLIVGLLTRFSAAVALVLALNYMLAKGAWFWTPSSNDAAFVAISLALLIGAAGRTLGIDAFLARRWPRSPLW